MAGGAHAEARRLLEESAEVFLESHNLDFGACALICLAQAELGLGRPDRARSRLHDALRPALEQGHGFALMSGLPAMALWLGGEGHAERAVEVYALASRYGHVAHSRWWEKVAGKRIAAAGATLPPDVVAAAQERGRARDLRATMEELLAELVET